MKFTTRAVAVAVMALAGAAGAGAQELHFAGTTSGCFYTGIAACVPASTPVSIGGLTYASGPGNQFDDYSDENGYLAMGDQWNNFGVFKLTNQSFDYSGWKFVLSVMFSAPPGVNSLTGASLTGVVQTRSGGVTLDFDNSVQSLLADDGTKFTFQVNDLSVTRGTVTNPGVGYVNGAVTVTPEPATIGLMLTGIVGLVPVIRRRQKRANA